MKSFNFKWSSWARPCLFAASFAMIANSCTSYEDDINALNQGVENLGSDLADLGNRVAANESNIKSLLAKKYVNSYAAVEGGYELTMSDGSVIFIKNGDKGDKGDQGIQGETGATGAQGDKGDKGDKGDQGIQGETGATGAQGDKGDKGDQGIQGETGATGAQGAAGQDGADGKDGADGENGTNGKDAETARFRVVEESGAYYWQIAYAPVGEEPTEDEWDYILVNGEKVNAQGPQGATGAQGDKGDKGDQGIQGETGATGAQGDKGDKGDQGIQGETGAQGAQGNAGINGTNGNDCGIRINEEGYLEFASAWDESGEPTAWTTTQFQPNAPVVEVTTSANSEYLVVTVGDASYEVPCLNNVVLYTLVAPSQVTANFNYGVVEKKATIRGEEYKKGDLIFASENADGINIPVIVNPASVDITATVGEGQPVYSFYLEDITTGTAFPGFTAETAKASFEGLSVDASGAVSTTRSSVVSTGRWTIPFAMNEDAKFSATELKTEYKNLALVATKQVSAVSGESVVRTAYSYNVSANRTELGSTEADAAGTFDLFVSTKNLAIGDEYSLADLAKNAYKKELDATIHAFEFKEVGSSYLGDLSNSDVLVMKSGNKGENQAIKIQINYLTEDGYYKEEIVTVVFNEILFDVTLNKTITLKTESSATHYIDFNINEVMSAEVLKKWASDRDPSEYIGGYYLYSYPDPDRFCIDFRDEDKGLLNCGNFDKAAYIRLKIHSYPINLNDVYEGDSFVFKRENGSILGILNINTTIVLPATPSVDAKDGTFATGYKATAFKYYNNVDAVSTTLLEFFDYTKLANSDYYYYAFVDENGNVTSTGNDYVYDMAHESKAQTIQLMYSHFGNADYAVPVNINLVDGSTVDKFTFYALSDLINPSVEAPSEAATVSYQDQTIAVKDKMFVLSGAKYSLTDTKGFSMKDNFGKVVKITDNDSRVSSIEFEFASSSADNNRYIVIAADGKSFTYNTSEMDMSAGSTVVVKMKVVVTDQYGSTQSGDFNVTLTGKN